MISVNGVTVSFGGYDLFDNISFLINPKDRIGLAGKNGAGKSTLLKVLSGNQNPTKGEIAMPKSCKIGYLPQDMIHQHGRTVFEETETAYEEIQQLELRINEINHQIEIVFLPPNQAQNIIQFFTNKYHLIYFQLMKLIKYQKLYLVMLLEVVIVSIMLMIILII